LSICQWARMTKPRLWAGENGSGFLVLRGNLIK
jgi:hypothetical protein